MRSDLLSEEQVQSLSTTRQEGDRTLKIPIRNKTLKYSNHSACYLVWLALLASFGAQPMFAATAMSYVARNSQPEDGRDQPPPKDDYLPPNDKHGKTFPEHQKHISDLEPVEPQPMFDSSLTLHNTTPL